jgi:hypothetical protein
MLRYLIAVSTAVALAATIASWAIVSIRNECVSESTAPKSTSTTNAKPQARVAPPIASLDLQISEQDRLEGKIYAEPWKGSRADWVHKVLCDIRAGELVVSIASVFLAFLAVLMFVGIRQLLTALRDSARAQRQESELIQRAYLSVHPGGVNPFDAASYAEGHVEIRNVGRLPARKVRWFIDAATSSDARRAHFPIGALSGNNVVVTGSELSQHARTAISRQEFQGFYDNNLWVYVWGTIRYDDGFGNERYTNFCHRYDARGFSPDVSGLSPQQVLQLGRAAISAEAAIFHQHGNDAD